MKTRDAKQELSAAGMEWDASGTGPGRCETGGWR